MKRILLTTWLAALLVLTWATLPAGAQATITRAISRALLIDGTAAVPSIAFISSPTTGFIYGGAAGKVVLVGTTPILAFNDATSASPALKRSGTGLQVRLADDSAYAALNVGSLGINTAGNGLFFTALLASATAPSAPSSCGTSPAVTTANGTAAFVVTGGTGGTATGCTVTMPAATTGWVCHVVNVTQTAAHRADRGTVQTASTTTSVTWEYVTLSTGAATAFTASDVFRGLCMAY